MADTADGGAAPLSADSDPYLAQRASRFGEIGRHTICRDRRGRFQGPHAWETIFDQHGCAYRGCRRCPALEEAFVRIPVKSIV